MLIENSNFRLKDIPNYHPELEYYDRMSFWGTEKRKCIEGYWVSGKWMPGPLYYYINFHNILFEDDSSVSQSVGLPFLRDIDWELFLYYEECRGFSGFEKDLKFTCDRKYGPELEESIMLGRITQAQADSKTYIDAREYLRRNHGTDLGKPLYKNSAKHFFSIQARGSGKAQPWFTKIYTPDGYKLMKDIEVGDQIIGSQGTPITVLEKHPQGKQQVWEVEFQDGRKSYCHEGHLWEVSKRGKKDNKLVLSTKELYELGVVKDLGYRVIYHYYIPKSPVTQHTKKEQSIPPYVLGALLGDGTISTLTPKIASSDDEVIERFKILLPDYEIKHDSSTDNNHTIVYRGVRGTHNNRFGAPSIPDKTNPLTTAIRDMQLNVTCSYKFIPDNYKYGSVEQRLELVKGLMDSDGSCNKGGQCEFTNSSLQLVKDLREVLSSLGIRCHIGKSDDRVGRIQEYQGHLIRCNKVMHRLHINPSDTIIFHLTRKIARQGVKSTFDKVAIKSIKPLDSKHEQFCVTVDAKDHLYLTEDYIVTHNSYSSSALCGHNFLFDGATDYDVYLKHKKEKRYLASDTIIGAIDTKYSAPLMKKTITAFEYYPGAYKIGDNIYPSPLMVSYSGSPSPNKDMTSRTGSFLRHRTFKDNPLAANGTRPNLCVLDEVGFHYNIKETWGAIEAIQQSKEKKNLVIWALGTGGLVSGHAALYAESIFRNPDEYNCIAFDDEFENRGTIGYFVPYWLTMNEFKKNDINMVTDEEKAKLAVSIRREKAKKANDASVYQTEIINGPMTPSEAFLVMEGSYFPTLLLKEQLAEVEGGKYAKFVDSSFKGILKFDSDDQVEFETQQESQPIRNFPLTKGEDKEGTVEIWVKPQKNDDGVIPYGTYIGGMDVVDKARSTTDSLPCIFIMNRYTRQIVAEYTGRTDDPNDFYEVCRKLLLYYRATGMYEQNLPGLYTYFQQKKSTYLLADTPYQLRNSETYKMNTNTSKGINASNTVNSTGRDFIKSWLSEPISSHSEKLVLNTIYSPACIKELISWNPNGNFDRVSALGMLLWHDATMTKAVEKQKNEPKGFLENDYFKGMGLLKKAPDNPISNNFYE